MLQAISKVGLSYGYMIFLSWQVAVVVTIMCLPMPIANHFFTRRIRHLALEAKQREAAIRSSLQDILTGIAVIKTFNAGEYFTDRFGRAVLGGLKAALARKKAESVHGKVMDVLDNLVFIAAIALSGYYSITGMLSPGDVVAVVQLLNWIIWPFTGIATIFVSLQSSLASVEWLKEMDAEING